MKNIRSILLSVLVCLFGCSPSVDDKIKISINPWPGYEFLYLAEQKGIFEQVGLNIELVQTSTLSDAQRAYINNYVDGFTSTLVEAIQVEPLGGNPIKVVLLPDFSNGGDVILASKSIQSVTDLKGKNIGCEVSSLGIYILQRALSKYGLLIEDVNIINTEQANGKKALMTGEIDAFITYPPYSIETLHNPEFHTVFSTAEIPNQVLDTVSMSTKVLNKHPDFVSKFHQAWQMALDYYQQHPEESTAIMAQREQISSEEFTAVLSDLKILSLDEQQKLFQQREKFIILANSVCKTLNAVKSIESNCLHVENILP
jgi:NitT/TauT family transport system substrate-binding protein